MVTIITRSPVWVVSTVNPSDYLGYKLNRGTIYFNRVKLKTGKGNKTSRGN